MGTGPGPSCRYAPSTVQCVVSRLCFPCCGRTTVLGLPQMCLCLDRVHPEHRYQWLPSCSEKRRGQATNGSDDLWGAFNGKKRKDNDFEGRRRGAYFEHMISSPKPPRCRPLQKQKSQRRPRHCSWSFGFCFPETEGGGAGPGRVCNFYKSTWRTLFTPQRSSKHLAWKTQSVPT